MRNIVIISLALFFTQFFTSLAQTYSTTAGGPWNQPSTWVGNVVPGPNENVVLVGPVTVEGLTFCHNLSIQAGGSLQAQSNIQPYMFYASGDIWNQGTIDGENWQFPLKFTIGGNLFNDGTWRSYDVIFNDTLTHILRSGPGTEFSPTIVHGDSATIESDQDLFLDNVELHARKVILEPDNFTFQPTTLYFTNNSILEVDQIMGQNNAISGDSSSYISSGIVPYPTLSNLHIRGETVTNTDLIANNSLVIDDTLRPKDGVWYIEPTITVNGNVQNDGMIIPNNIGYKLLFKIEGNLLNNGYWDSRMVEFTGSGTHTLFTDLNQIFSPDEFYAVNATVFSDSSLRFDNVDIRVRKFVLQNNDALYLESGSRLEVDSLIGNGNNLFVHGHSYLSSALNNPGLVPVFSNLILNGEVNIVSDVNFTGNTINSGILKIKDTTNFSYQATFEGNFRNLGSIRPNNMGYKLWFEITGNLENSGLWQSGAVELKSASNQHVGISDSSAGINELKIHAMRTGTTYQWLRNGIPLSNGGNITGATSPVLVFQTATPGDNGIYKCQIDSSGTTIYSREVTIDNNITGINNPKDKPKTQIPDQFSLSQNYPNPFNPGTMIEFRVSSTSHVTLEIYNILGQRIRVLVNEIKQPSVYRVYWDGQDEHNQAVGSGTYICRMQAGDFVATRQMLLVK